MFVNSPNEQRGNGRGQGMLRAHNTAAVLHLIWSGHYSRADIARSTGLSRSTVTGIVGGLLQVGVVQESSTQSSGGRPSILLRVNQRVRLLVGIEMGASHISSVLTDLQGNFLSTRSEPVDVQGQPQLALQHMETHIHEMLAELKLNSSALAGIGLAVPCPLAQSDVLDLNILPLWRDIRPAAQLRARFGVPVMMDNDANLGALAELWWGAGRGVGDFSYIKLATGVGAGQIINGQVYRGSGGIAGEIGHTAIDANGPLCRCGLRGCLEAMVGREALERQVGTDLESLIKNASAGDPASISAIENAGTYMGIAVANLLNLMNPARVILGGALTQAGDLLLTPLIQAVEERALFSTVESSRVVLSQIGPQAVAKGAATLVLQAALNDHSLLTPMPAMAGAHSEALQ
jgi:predicted NBD/HSP70 family sugar kinase